MFLTTKMVVGKLGYHSLAAVGIAGDLSFEFLIVLLALLSSRRRTVGTGLSARVAKRTWAMRYARD